MVTIVIPSDRYERLVAAAQRYREAIEATEKAIRDRRARSTAKGYTSLLRALKIENNAWQEYTSLFQGKDPQAQRAQSDRTNDESKRRPARSARTYKHRAGDQ